jgi:hypothetical protein
MEGWATEPASACAPENASAVIASICNPFHGLLPCRLHIQGRKKISNATPTIARRLPRMFMDP